MNIPFSPPDITEAEINEVAEALRSGWSQLVLEQKNLRKGCLSIAILARLFV